MRRSYWLPVALGIGILACDSDPSDQGGDTGFRVTAVQPADGASDVAWTATFKATLSAPLDPASLVTGTVNLSRGAAAVPAVVSYDASAQAIRIVAPLVPGTTYQAQLGSALRSLDGDSLRSHTWTVTTRPWQAEPIVPAGELEQFDLAIGPSGSLHLFGDGEYRRWSDYATPYFKYVACASNCADPASWGRMAVDSGYAPYSRATELVVSPSGRVHLLYTIDTVPSELRYGTCASDCLNPASWTFATLDTSRAVIGFTQDAGVLHLVTGPFGATPDSLPAPRYATCQASCEVPANWVSTPFPVLSREGDLTRALQVDPSGGLHLLSQWHLDLHYSYCPSDCLSPSQWSTIPVEGAGDNTYSPSFTVDGGGAVHLVFTDADKALVYAHCAAACADPSAWQRIVLGPGDYYGSAVTVDATGRITVVVPLSSAGELRFLSCVTGCLEADNWEAASAGLFEARIPGNAAPRLGIDPSGRLRVVSSDVARKLRYFE